MNLLEQQAANRRRTWLIMATFIAFVAFIGFGFDAFMLRTGRPFVPIGGVVALGVGSVSVLTSYYSGDKAVLASAGAVPLAQVAETSVGETRFRLHQLQNVVDEMAIAAGLPRPKAYVVADPDPNAFATGRDPAHASIAVTQGLLDSLDRAELQGVVAHEMSHIRNYDIRLMTMTAALIGAVVLLSDWAGRAMRWGAFGRGGGRRDRDSRGGGAAVALVVFIIWVIAVVVAPFVAQLLALAVSRQREYLADASGAELTRDPSALADALEKIEAHVEPTGAIKRGSAHLCIADPLGRRMGLKEGFWADLLATHPPMARRIAALRQMAFQRA
jgi:heat shock protein HtpX